MQGYKPNTIKLDLVQGCNRSCTFCGTNGFERKVYFATEETIQRECNLIKEAGITPRIFLAGIGEPTLHPNLIKMLSIIRKTLPKCWIQLITNGNYENKLDFIQLQTEVEIFNSTHPEIKCRFEELHETVPFYAPIKFKEKRILVIPDIILQEGNKATRKFENHCGAGMPPTDTHREKKCTMIFRQLKFRYDGTVAICCDDFRGQYYVTSIYEKGINTLEDIWYHERLVSARKVLYHLKRKAMYPCCVCNAMVSRVGLLPKIEKPTQRDIEIVRKKYPPLTKIVKREWEK